MFQKPCLQCAAAATRAPPAIRRLGGNLGTPGDSFRDASKRVTLGGHGSVASHPMGDNCPWRVAEAPLSALTPPSPGSTMAEPNL